MMKSQCLVLFIQLILVLACAPAGQVVHKSSGISLSAETEMGQGTVLYTNGCYRQSLSHFLKAHELFSAIDKLDGVAMCLNNIGNVYRIINDSESALPFFNESFNIYLELNDQLGAVQALSNKAAALIAHNDLEAAEQTLLKAKNMAKTAGISFHPLLRYQGVLLIKQKKYPEAEQMLRNALKKTGKTSLSERAAIYFALGNVMSETKLFEEAISYYLIALESDRKTGFHKGIADDLAAVGSTYIALNKNREAAQFLKRSIKIYALMGDKDHVTKILAQLNAVTKDTEIDTTLIKKFVESWLSGEIEKPLCE